MVHETVKISADEEQLYDRQIRLWGLDAQNKLRNASVLIIGVTGLGAEVAKTLILAGVYQVSLVDKDVVAAHEMESNFFISPEDVGKNRAEASFESLQKLNPLVKLTVENFDSLSDDDFLKSFELVIVLDQIYNLTKAINNKCRADNIKFQAGGVYGWIGYAFTDYNKKPFMVKKEIDIDCYDDSKTNGVNGDIPSIKVTDEPEMEEKQFEFTSYEETLNFVFDFKNMKASAKRKFPFRFPLIQACVQLGENEGPSALKETYETWLEQNGYADARLNIDDDKYKFYRMPQLGLATSVLGGMIGQQAISVVSQDSFKIKNFFIYSPDKDGGLVYDIPKQYKQFAATQQ
uniref:ThiF domain-containing protein n=1 Tax=Rhabditophanes sp. KR3021 TaxID=114890 RepID=A0AC35UFT9_9BILA